MASVGYGTLNGVNYWIIRHSLVSGLGQAGIIFVKRGVNMCGIEDGEGAYEVSA